MTTAVRARVVRVFLSSPGDLQAERRAAAEVIDHLDKSLQFQDQVKLVTYTYEDRVPARAAQGPQRSVDTYMLRPEEADILVCFLWRRMGSPTKDLINPETDQPYHSGTEYEFLSAYRASQAHARPIVLLYRCTRALPPEAPPDPAQQALVDAFFERFDPEGDLLAMRHTFTDEASWRAVLARDLEEVLRRDFPVQTQGVDARPPVYFLPDKLPNEYVPRPDALDRLRKALLGSQSQVGVVAAAAVHGQGGLGKTVLARAICDDVAVRAAFPDGILWSTLGQHPDLLSLQQEWIRQLGGDLGAAGTRTQAKAVLQQLLEGRRMLLVLDDVWQASDAQALQVGGSACRLLITTRNVATTGGAALVPLELMRRQESRALLSQASGGVVQDTALADEIADRVGYLPLALRLIGAQLERGVPWSAVRTALDNHDLQFLGMEQADMLSAIATSVDALPPAEQPRYLELAIFPQDEPLDPRAVGRLWAATAGLKSFETDIVLGGLRARALLQRDNSLHDLQHDYVQHEVSRATQQRLHEQLTDAYGTRANWPLLAADETYAWRRLAWHLLQAGRLDDLRWLVTNGTYLQRKIDLLGIGAAMGDLLLLPGREEVIEQALGALRLSAPTLRQASSELENQLFGRLGPFPAIHDYLPPSHRPALRLRSQTLLGPGQGLFGTLEGHTRQVNGCAFSPDGHHIISASTDETLRLWDVATGQSTRTFDEHTGAMYGCAFSPDGLLVASASGEGTVLLWEVATGQTVLELEGHTDIVNGCAFSPDGSLLASVADDQTVRLWDVATGQSVRELVGHTDAVNSCAFSPDGRLLVSGSNDTTLRLWEVSTGQSVRTLEGHTYGVYGCAFSPDGLLVGSASADFSLRLWDVATGQSVRELVGHTDWVRGCAFSPDGHLLASASDDTTLRLWDVSTGQSVRTLEGHSDYVYGCAFSPDGHLLASASGDDTLRLWDVATGQTIQSSAGHDDYVNACAFSPDGLLVASVSDDHTVRLWDVTTGKCIRTLEGHTDRVYGCAFSSDGRLVASGSDDNTLRLWDVTTGQSVRTLEGHSGGVYSCAFSPNGSLLASASGDTTLRLWDVATGQCTHVLEGHSDFVRGCAFSPDGHLLASASDDKTLRLWDVATGQAAQKLEGHTDWVRGCAFSSDGHLLASASDDRTVRLWDASTGQIIHTLEGHTDYVFGCAFSPDGRLLASASDDRTVRVWDVIAIQRAHRATPWAAIRRVVGKTSDAPKHVMTGHIGAVISCAFSPDGRLIASASGDRTLRLWDVATGQTVRTLEKRDNFVLGCAFSPDGRLAASASDDRAVRLWEVASVQILRTLESVTGGVLDCDFSPNGRLIVGACTDDTLRLWDTASGQIIRTLTGHTDGINACAFGPHGNLLVSGSDDRTLRLWDVATGQSVRELAGHSSGVHSCAFSPDGLLIASASADYSLRLWDVATGQSVRELVGHTDWVRGCAFSPDGRLLASASDDRGVRLWDVSTGQSLRTLEGHTGYVYSCAFSPDGRFVVSVGRDRTVRLWDVATGSEQAQCPLDLPLLSCAWLPSEHTIVCGDTEGHLHFFNVLR